MCVCVRERDEFETLQTWIYPSTLGVCEKVFALLFIFSISGEQALLQRGSPSHASSSESTSVREAAGSVGSVEKRSN